MNDNKDTVAAKTTVAVSIPPGLCERFYREAEERGITASELVRELICSNFGRRPERHNPEFTVPLSAASLFSSDHYVVVRRTAKEITLTTAAQVPFEKVMEKFATLNLSEDEMMEVVGS